MEPTQEAQSRFDRRLLLLVPVAILLIVASFWWLLQRKPGDTTGPLIGPSASWSDQLAIAQREALKIDKDALLRNGGVDATSDLSDRSGWTYTHTLSITFDFVRPSVGADDIIISFMDAAPTSTLQITSRQTFGSNEDFYQRAKERPSGTLERLKISARQAVEITWPEMAAYTQQKGLPPQPSSVLMNLEVKDTSADWLVLYTITDPKIPTPTRDKTGSVVTGIAASYTVDAVTADILKRDFVDHRTLAPTPVP